MLGSAYTESHVAPRRSRKRRSDAPRAHATTRSAPIVRNRSHVTTKRMRVTTPIGTNARMRSGPIRLRSCPTSSCSEETRYAGASSTQLPRGAAEGL